MPQSERKRCWVPTTTEVGAGWGRYGLVMADALDIDAMIARFQARAAAVKKRNLPPVGGEERQQFLAQAQNDYMDFAMIGDSTAELVDGILTLRIDLRASDD